MADISVCTSADCTARKGCYRWRVKWAPRQSVFARPPGFNHHCGFHFVVELEEYDDMDTVEHCQARADRMQEVTGG